MTVRHRVIAFGPELPEFPSWSWIGADLAQALAAEHRIKIFRDSVPDCDVAIFIKFKPPLEQLRELSRRCSIVYCPVDVYGSAAEIDADWQSLQCCDLLIVHCRSLTQYVSPYVPKVEYLDHHLKFFAPLPQQRKLEGPILWTGNRGNLPPLVDWVNRHPLPEELWVLTDLDNDRTSPREHGFLDSSRVRTEPWSADRHREWAGIARAAIDIKGTDFRSRHKPPTKTHDAIASGLPLAMNLDSSPAKHLRLSGFQIVDPRDTATWFSQEYWEATQQHGQHLRAELMLPQLARRFRTLLARLVARQPVAADSSC